MNHRFRLILGGLGALVLVAALVFVVILMRPSPTRTIVRIGYLNITASLPLFVAEANGYFTDEGLAIKTHQIASSNQLVDGIVGGSLDLFVEASAVPVLAVELQSPGRLKVFSVSSITREAPFDALLASEEFAEYRGIIYAALVFQRQTQ